MDKHQRKQLARWEAKKTKTQEKTDRLIRKHFQEDAYDQVEAFAQSYKPDYKVLDGVIGNAVRMMIANEPPLNAVDLMSPFFARHTILEQMWMRDLYLWYSEVDYMYSSNRVMESSRLFLSRRPIPRHFRTSAYGWFYQYKEDSLDMCIDVPKTIQVLREHADNTIRSECLREVRRSVRRLNVFRKEMLETAQKFRAIHNCRLVFKEELMMNVWHPRRVEHILETYGWDAYENLLGL